MTMFGYPEKIDLHIHTTASDGTDTLPELLSKVRDKGIGLFSVTDHDNIKAAEQMPAELGSGDPVFVSGVEISCRDTEGRYHILGYGYDPERPGIREMVQKVHGLRMERLEGRLSCLEKDFGITFPAEEVELLRKLDNPGKPHIGNLMVKYGYSPDRNTAISEYIEKIKFKGHYISPAEAINAVLASGGIPILAHPFFGSGGQRITGGKMEERMKRLMEMGLQGVEAYYSTFTPGLISEMLTLAKKYDLYITAGSDYHGANKTIELGFTNLPDASEYPEGLMNFMDSIKSRCV